MMYARLKKISCFIWNIELKLTWFYLIRLSVQSKHDSLKQIYYRRNQVNNN